MKTLFVFAGIILWLNACHTKKQKSLLTGQVDELKIIFLKDSFAFISYDSSTIKHFNELITLDDEALRDTCGVTEELLFMKKGKPIFSAQVSIENIGNGVSCNEVSYIVAAKKYRHRLTYQTGMGIDELSGHKITPQDTLTGRMDSLKFHYKDLKVHISAH